MPEFNVIDKEVYVGRDFPDVFLGRHTLAKVDQEEQEYVRTSMPERVDVRVSSVFPIVYVNEYTDNSGNTYHVPMILTEPYGEIYKVEGEINYHNRAVQEQTEQQSTIYKAPEYVYQKVDALPPDAQKTGSYLLTALVGGYDKAGNFYVSTFPNRINIPSTLVLRRVLDEQDERYTLYSTVSRTALYSKAADYKAKVEEAIQKLVAEKKVTNPELINEVRELIDSSKSKHAFVTSAFEQVLPYYAKVIKDSLPQGSIVKELSYDGKTVYKFPERIMDYKNGLIPLTDLLPQTSTGQQSASENTEQSTAKSATLTFVRAPIPADSINGSKPSTLIRYVMHPAALNGKPLTSFLHNVNLLSSMASKIKYHSVIALNAKAKNQEIPMEKLIELDQFKKDLQASKMFSTKTKEFVKILGSIPKADESKLKDNIAFADGIIEHTRKCKEILRQPEDVPSISEFKSPVDYALFVQSRSMISQLSDDIKQGQSEYYTKVPTESAQHQATQETPGTPMEVPIEPGKSEYYTTAAVEPDFSP